jgi:hypothetical protein
MPKTYCVRCHKKTHTLNPKLETLHNGRKAVIGTCEVCEGKKVTFVSNDVTDLSDLGY